MKIDGLDWLDWLHKVRRESEAKRRRDGVSGEEWLRQVEQRAGEVRREVDALGAPVARDKQK